MRNRDNRFKRNLMEGFLSPVSWTRTKDVMRQFSKVSEFTATVELEDPTAGYGALVDEYDIVVRFEKVYQLPLKITFSVLNDNGIDVFDDLTPDIQSDIFEAVAELVGRRFKITNPDEALLRLSDNRGSISGYHRTLKNAIGRGYLIDTEYRRWSPDSRTKSIIFSIEKFNVLS